MSMIQVRKQALKSLISYPQNYLKVYEGILSATVPTKFEKFLYSIGMRERATRRRAARIDRRLKKSLDVHKNEAKNTLSISLVQSRNLLNSAQRMNATALGTQIREEPRYKVLRRQLASLEENIADTIKFVKKASAVRYPKNHINWAKVDAKVLPEVMALDIKQRTRIQQEWRMYTELLRDVDRAHRLLNESKSLERYTAFVEDLTTHFYEMYQEELYRVDERFELIGMLLRAQQLGELDKFFAQDVRQFRLETINEDVNGMKEAVDDYEEPDFDFLERQAQPIN
ncbi:MAG: hypothetical protein U0670_13065 [Anaerolineae bacterium]